MQTFQPLSISLLLFLIPGPTKQLVEGQSPASSKILLKCTASNGEPVSDLEIDLAGKRMTWGAFGYEITSVTNRYISAYETMDGVVGGETWVLDRTTGKYVRAAVALFCDTSSCENQKLGTGAYRGVCAKNIF
jgi:hypothetical protein